ncbi:UvrD-helicase domain-containing protein [Lewinella sp. 4G2]|uniref:UvrD-helicase domain-containing protein n=1 Tax=Lewinella sp. 4G2 TaxID=1803372 RepID=UPI0007B4DEC5|nr:UvrD-helicase domain-containing protein [Lewinella sp. 4G2]OAV46231.1 DNA/RNA helicase [Lewinella sp. 4G2]
MKFTAEQETIFDFVRAGSGHGIIDAVAGAGKTTTIMECVRFTEAPNRVLFCAFNNAIAQEIRRKFKKRGLGMVSVQTNHSLGLRLLRQNPTFDRKSKISDLKYLSIYKSDAMQRTLGPLKTELVELNGLKGTSGGARAFAAKNLEFKIQRKLLDMNQKHRSCLNGPKETRFREMVMHYGIFNDAEECGEHFEEELKIYFQMHRMLLEEGNRVAAEEGLIDFTDMIYLPFIWKLESPVRYQWIFIDECQDLSKAQFAIAAKYGKKGSRILAVGDPRQSIYGFTGADAESFDRIKRMTKATQLPLTLSFRCPKAVIELAQTIRPDIRGSKRRKGKVSEILRSNILRHLKQEDMVISRLRAPLLLLAFDLIDKNARVQLAPDEVNEVMSELKSLFKPAERQATIKRQYKSFKAFAEQVESRNLWVIRQDGGQMPNPDAREKYLEAEAEYLKRRLEFLGRKYRQWSAECRSIDAVLDRIKEYLSSKKDAIRLSTIHRAKGLEEKRVFILDYDKMPLHRHGQKDWEMVQEENLQYVAITRAEESLYLVLSTEAEEELIKEGQAK